MKILMYINLIEFLNKYFFVIGKNCDDNNYQHHKFLVLDLKLHCA